jgi:phosphomannomutase
MTRSNEAFKAYDIRGIYDKDIDAHLAFLLGKGIATYLIKQY